MFERLLQTTRHSSFFLFGKDEMDEAPKPPE